MLLPYALFRASLGRSGLRLPSKVKRLDHTCSQFAFTDAHWQIVSGGVTILLWSRPQRAQQSQLEGWTVACFDASMSDRVLLVIYCSL